MDEMTVAAAAEAAAYVNADPTAPDAAPGTAHAMALLRAGVPLSLLLDLATPVHSDELMRVERADTAWVPRAVA